MANYKIQCWGHCSNSSETDDLAGFISAHDATSFLVTKTSALPLGVPNPNANPNPNGNPQQQTAPTANDNSTVGTTGGQ